MGSEDLALARTRSASNPMEIAPSTAVAEPIGLLVERCTAGDETAWRHLHRRYHSTAVGVLLRLGVRPQQLEDCVQDVFLDVFRYLPGFRGDADFKTWLYRICMSRARVARRRARLRACLDAVLPLGRTEAASPPLDESLASRRIADALAALTEAERAVFVLFELEGLPGKEIATILGCPEATVFRRLFHARQRFTAAVQAQGGFEP